MKKKKITENIIFDIFKRLVEFDESNVDLSDIGNEIGIAVGENILNVKKLGFDVDSFINGFKHGISLTDGTH